MPVFNDVKQKSGEGHAWGFVIALSLVYLVCAGFVALLGIAIASNLISLIAPTLPEAVELLASKLLRILFPTVALFGIALIGSNALAARRSFWAIAFSSSIFNLIVIGVVLKWGARTGVISWGIGIILGAIAQASFVVFLMCRNIRAEASPTGVFSVAIQSGSQSLRMTAGDWASLCSRA